MCILLVILVIAASIVIILGTANISLFLWNELMDQIIKYRKKQ